VLQTDIYTDDVPAIFNRFRDAIDERHWLKRVTLIQSEIRNVIQAPGQFNS
jgi:hypothetical protein